MNEADDCEWVEKLLRSSAFRKHIDVVQRICISSKVNQTTRDHIRQCSCVVLYQTRQIIEDLQEPVEISEINQHVIIVTGGVKDRESEENIKKRWEKTKTHKDGLNMMLFTNAETDYCIKNPELTQEKGKLAQINEIITSGTSSSIGIMGPANVVVGIFSRSSKIDYKWLQDHLTSETSQNIVKHVQPFYISNSNRMQFREVVGQCTFGILYHTKKRGRVNVTDVTDSLYDDELTYLHDVLGKEKVIVVIDDLENSSEEEKIRILQNQHSIGSLAKDLILFTKDEKDPNYKKSDPLVESLVRKRDSLIELIEEGKKRMENAANVLKENTELEEVSVQGEKSTKPPQETEDNIIKLQEETQDKKIDPEMETENKKTEPEMGTEDKKTKPEMGTEDKKTEPEMGTEDKKTEPEMGTEDKKTEPEMGTEDKKTEPEMGTEDKKTEPEMGTEDKKTEPEMGTKDKRTETPEEPKDN
ncbi:HIRA-interacting protein 3 [Discoglossus pictus]